MKKLNVMLTMILLVVSGNVFAQVKQSKKCTQCTPEQRMEQRVKHLQQALSMDDATAAKFAPLYKEYMEEMKSCFAKPEARQKKADRTDEQILQDMKDRFAQQKKVLETKEKYFGKFQKILNARQLEKLFAPRYGKMATHAKSMHRAGVMKPGKPCGNACCQVKK